MTRGPLKIAVIQRFLPSRSRGGVGYFTHGLCNALQRRGFAVTVFSQDVGPSDALYRTVVLPLGPSMLGHHFAPFVFPIRVAKQDFSGYDLLHAQGDDHLICGSGRPPLVRTIHGSALLEAVHNGVRRLSAKRFLMHMYFYGCELVADTCADLVVVVSRDTGRYYPRVHAVIPNGVDIGLFCPPTGERAKNPTILFVGELNSRKRGGWLLKVVNEKVRPALPNVEVWLVCPEMAVGDGIRWFGMVESSELARLYREAWVCCLPSSYEGFGRPYIEAMAAGTPVVATRNPGAEEVLGNGRYGVVVSDAELGEALCKLLNRADLRREYSERGSERVKAYTWEKVVEQYEVIYERALQNRARG